ncbi:hypothetical protein OTB20_32845 [Streptomyces sp. H27-H1]|uniref:hypothetical protein n=1 Tax=Streptomyces sp. H27-H1 TaxID=2996461 RepID=UPI00226ECF2F|nr:hypothetical protein [Streptomyces sp. H27-H1]MCY0930899.1 hypothetical protein [Streptomyces sp. H27-H1]
MLPADEDPCNMLGGPAKQYCEDDGPSAPGDPADSLDPLTALAKSIADAADWTARQLGKAVADRSAVDFTNAGFLKQYAIVFAASTVLVLVLWLLSVAKRAVRGVPMTTAMGEAIGLLWLAVLASAFTPLILYTVIGAVSAVTDVLVSALGSEPGGLFNSLGADLKNGKVGGGPLLLAVTSFATLLLCGALWLLLILRTLGLYVGALLGVVVYSGLVNRDWWGHTRRWAGFMAALIAAEPVIVIVLGLSSALKTSGNVVTGLAVTVIALGIAVSLIWKVPGMGDAVKVARMTARTASGTARTVTGTAGATTGVLRGIQTHGGRSDNADRSSAGTQKQPNPVTGGISAHAQRKPKDTN